MSSRSMAHHPVGLYLLCTIELCERFAGSLLGSLMLLYLNERLGMAAGTATRLNGAFSGVVYGAAVLGGLVADRFLGTRRAILLGASLLAIGYWVLSMDGARALHPAAGLLVLGHALFKPNLSAAVGRFYGREDRRRDDAYSLYYVVFNIGAALGPVAGGALRAAHGWSLAFRGAALAMLLALVLGILNYGLLAATEHHNEQRSLEPQSERVAGIPMLLAMTALLGAVLIFTATYEQSGQSLLFWSRDCTRRSLLGHTVPPSYLLGVPGILVLVLQPVLSRLLAALARRGREPSELTRIQAGMLCAVAAYGLMVGAAIIHGQHRSAVSAAWLIACLVALTLGELLVYPVSMALITRLAPPNRAAAATGIWMAAVAVGVWLAGELAARWPVWSHTTFFAALAAIALGAAALLGLATQQFRRALTGPNAQSNP